MRPYLVENAFSVLHRRSPGQSGANEVARAAQINGADIAWRRSRGAAYEHAHAAIRALHPLAVPLSVGRDELRHQRQVNPQKAWEGHDINDVPALSIAVPTATWW